MPLERVSNPLNSFLKCLAYSAPKPPAAIGIYLYADLTFTHSQACNLTIFHPISTKLGMIDVVWVLTNPIEWHHDDVTQCARSVKKQKNEYLNSIIIPIDSKRYAFSEFSRKKISSKFHLEGIFFKRPFEKVSLLTIKKVLFFQIFGIS